MSPWRKRDGDCRQRRGCKPMAQVDAMVLLASADSNLLDEKEGFILEQMATGATNVEIAALLDISQGRIRQMHQALRKKLGC